MSEIQLREDSKLANQSGENSNKSSSNKTTKTSTKTVKQTSSSSSSKKVTNTKSSSSTSSSSTSKCEEMKSSSTATNVAISSAQSSDTNSSSSNDLGSNQNGRQLARAPQTGQPPVQQSATQKKAVNTVVEEKMEVQKSESLVTTKSVVGADGIVKKSEEVKEAKQIEKAAKRDEKNQELVEKMATDDSGRGVCLAQTIKEEASSARQQSVAEASSFTRTGPDGKESGSHEDAKEEATFRREIKVQANAAAYIGKRDHQTGELLKLTPSKTSHNGVNCTDQLKSISIGADQSDHATLNFDLNEFESESISIVIEDNKMTVHAMKKKIVGDEEMKEEFSREYDLSDDQIDQSHVTSSIYQDGVLSIQLPYKSAILGH